MMTMQILETDNELEQCKQRETLYLKMEEATAQKLWSIGQSYFSNIDDSEQQDSIDNVKVIVQKFSADVINFNDDGYDGRNCSLMGTPEGVEFDWSFVGSLLFAITIYTTVGLSTSYLFTYLIYNPLENLNSGRSPESKAH